MIGATGRWGAEPTIRARTGYGGWWPVWADHHRGASRSDRPANGSIT